MYLWQITSLEKDGIWTPEWDPSINPIKPDALYVDKLSDSISISCSGPKYSGALAKCVSVWLFQSQNITLTYEVMFDETINYGQVIESDSEFTDAAGWTYPGDFQFNIAEGWMTQTGNPWVDSGTKIPLKMNQWNQVQVQYHFDYTNKTISINGLAPVSAAQRGWTPNEIVTQLQLCVGPVGGHYWARFSQIGYSGQ